MYPNHSLVGPGAGLLPRHLDQLGEALSRLGTQARADLARTLAHAAAGLVCDVVSAALAAPAPRRPHQAWPAREAYAPLHDAFDDPYARYDDPYAQEDDLDYRWEDHAPWPRPQPERPEPVPAEAWPAALAVGLRLAAWWLARRPGRLLAALALGAATTAAGVAGGPLILGGLCLAETLLNVAAAEGATLLGSRLLTRPD